MNDGIFVGPWKMTDRRGWMPNFALTNRQWGGAINTEQISLYFHDFVFLKQGQLRQYITIHNNFRCKVFGLTVRRVLFVLASSGI